MDIPKTERLMLAPDSIREISGFGMACRADGYLVQPTSIDGIREVFAMAKASRRQIVLRGAGRSYGDASILAEGIVLDLTNMNRFLSWDSASGIADCEPGVTIEDIWRAGLPNGWWPPVVSGTMLVTLGGALSMNIHGKNNYQAGALGDHVLEIDLLTADGRLTTLTREDQLFRAVISSAGLLGVIVRVKLQLKKVASGNLKVYAESIPNWDAQFEAFDRRAESADYMVSWVDGFGRGKASGRGLFHAAWHDTDSDLESLLELNQDLSAKMLGVLPKSEVWRLLRPLNNRLGMRMLNAAKYWTASLIARDKMQGQGLVPFSFLLDYVPDWRRAYLPGGFIQYQSFVPSHEARNVFASQIEMSQVARLEPFLGVLKKHRQDGYLMSHGVDGYSLALDYKVTERNWPTLQSLCHRMNDLVIDAAGKFYLAKDSTLRRKDLEATIGPSLDQLLKLKLDLDPNDVLSSEMARRLKLSNGNLRP